MGEQSHNHTPCRCSRETDGAGSYNSVFVALFTLQLGQGGSSGSIRVVAHSHNEPGHGADICDTAGANCVRECWRYTKRTGLSIISAEKTVSCLTEAKMDGFLHLQVTPTTTLTPPLTLRSPDMSFLLFRRLATIQIRR